MKRYSSATQSWIQRNLINKPFNEITRFRKLSDVIDREHIEWTYPTNRISRLRCLPLLIGWFSIVIKTRRSRRLSLYISWNAWSRQTFEGSTDYHQLTLNPVRSLASEFRFRSWMIIKYPPVVQITSFVASGDKRHRINPVRRKWMETFNKSNKKETLRSPGVWKTFW